MITQSDPVAAVAHDDDDVVNDAINEAGEEDTISKEEDSEAIVQLRFSLQLHGFVQTHTNMRLREE